MKGLDFSNMNFSSSDEQGEKCEGILSIDTPIRQSDLVSKEHVNVESVEETALVSGSIGVVVSAIGKVIPLIDTSIKCHAKVMIEREHTKQVRAKSQALIRMAEEKTKQIKIEEEGMTKRLLIEKKAELESQKVELKRIKIILKNEENKNYQNYMVIMKGLDILGNSVNSILEYNKILLREFSETINDNRKNELYNQIEYNLKQLIDLAAKIVEYREGIK